MKCLTFCGLISGGSLFLSLVFFFHSSHFRVTQSCNWFSTENEFVSMKISNQRIKEKT